MPQRAMYGEDFVGSKNFFNFAPTNQLNRL